MTTNTPPKIAFANSLRGFAALCVVVYHYGFIFWHERVITGLLVNAPVLDGSRVPTPQYLQWVAELPFDLGAFGVALFFLISGFVIPYAFISTTRVGFAIGRIFRILPPYAIGFTCTLVVVYLSGEFFQRPFAYEVSAVVAHYFPGLQDLALTRGIDGIIWTLNIEVKFYVVCVVIAGWLASGNLRAFIAPLVLTAVAWVLIPVTATVGGTVAARATSLYLAIQYIDFMFIGVAFNYLLRGALSALGASVLTVALYAGMTAIWWRAAPVLFDREWAYAAALLVFATAFMLRESAMFRSSALMRFLAEISYPLYVVHGVLGYVVIRVLLELGWDPAVAIAATFGGVICLATAIHFGIERPSHRMGKSIARRFGRACR
ncbi:acyltransferase family protein [Cupriavidus necator]|uniref:acyltransferase family protein n=1 Tax=Cupriavidus necator TaxID=106590 RepID=UPI00277DF82E|nr:acyltransferase [Cupriavidus necator]MDQ0140085.1 peptidoglycan/LPS O-acetylase OafA/YrhL [Cupriavidus necator]